MECHDEPTVTRSSSESDCTSYPQLSEITLASDPTSSSFQSLDLMTNNFYTATTGLITDFSSGPLSPVPGGSHGDHSTEPHNPRSSPYHPSSTRTPAQTPSSSPKKAAPPASNPSSDLSIHRHPTPQRLSVLRQGGTANVLDLASLVRSARDRAQQSKEFICSPPTYNYYTSTSSLDSPPVRPSLSESIDGKPSTLGPSLEPRSALVSQSSQHIAGPAWPYCLSENKLRSYTPAELDSSPSSSVRLPSVDAQSLAELTSTRSQQPRLSSSLLDDADQEEEIESMELRASDPTSELEAIAMASCLPISMDTMRSSAGPRKRKPQRSKSQGGGLYAFWAGGPPETVPGSSVDSCAATHSSLPPVTRARPRACSGPSPSDPQLVSSSAVPKKPPQISSSTMRKKSGFFRRKLSTSLSQADLKCEQLPTANSHQPLQLAFSPTFAEPLVPRHPLTNDISQQHQQDKALNSTPPVPNIPSSYHRSSSSQPNNNISHSPMPLKSRLSSAGSTRQSLARPASAGHSQDSEDSRQDQSTPTNSKTLANSHQEAFRKSMSASQLTRHGSPSESLFSPSASSRSHSPARSSTKQHPPLPSPSSQPKSSWLHSTSRALVSYTEQRADPLSPRAAQSRPPSSTNLPPSSLSKTRTIPAPFDLRSGKTRPVLTPTTFLGSSSSTLGGADSGQLGSSAGPASQHASASISSSLLSSDSPSQTHRLSNLSSTGLSEEDKLRLSLERWNLDQDGVLRGGLSSISPQTPKASASDLIDPSNPHAQDGGISERVFNKPLVLNPATSHQYNLNKNPPPPDSAALSASTCLPSLVNPNRTAIQSRYPAEPLDKSLSQSRIRALNLDHSSPIPSSSLAIVTSPALSSQQSPSSDGSTIQVNPGSISSPNLSTTSGLSSPQGIVSRASSMKESRELTFSPLTSVRSVNLRRRGYTEDDCALAPKILGSQFPAASRRPQISSQPVSRTTSAETAPGSTVEPLLGLLTHEDEDSETDDPLSLLSPSIRLVSSSDSTTSELGHSNSVNTTNQSTHPMSTASSSKPPISPNTQSHPRSTLFNRGDLSAFSKSSGHVSSSIRTHQPQSSKPAPPKRGNAGLGIKPIVEPDRSIIQHIPQLQRRDLDQAQPTKLGPASDDIRTPRNHQSSPNLRSLRPSTPPDSSFFSVIVSGPQQPEEDSRTILPPSRENLAAHSNPHSLPTSAPSPNLEHSDKPDSVHSNPPHSLHVPGMTLQANAHRLAELFWQEDESIIKRRKLTEWLGSPETSENQLQALTRRAFMDKFDFKDLRIDLAFRKLCTKMYLKGETQQVDRILAEFSRRYWEQNQSNIYVNADMVHAMSYSILLLNTDLHVVDTTSRMSRSQFIRNTMETVYAQLSQFDLPEANRSKASIIEPSRPSSTTADTYRANFKMASNGSMATRNRRTSFVDLTRVLPASGTSSHTAARPSMERWRDALRTGSQPVIKTSRRSHSITSWPSEDDLPATSGVYSPLPGSSSTDHERHASLDTGASCSPAASRADDLPSTVNLRSAENGSPAPKASTKAQFEKEVESLLKDIYMAVKSHPIAQNLAEPQSQEPGAYGSLQRMASRRNHYTHGVADSIGTHKRASLRGFGGFAALLSAGPDTPGGRPNSPTPSASTSVSSLPSGMMGYSSNAGSSLNLTNLTTPSIGFVSNLSQSIIREQHEEESLESSQVDDEQTRDSELALLGAPWAKEGILQRKQYWESKGKRHKDRGWAQVFVVIQTGVLKMFQFGNSGGSSAGAGMAAGSTSNEVGATTTISSEGVSGVGGGNWLPNAQLLGAITLSHALTSVLVSGYSKERAHVFVLTLSTGASYFFQAGTEELVYEWVSTCNYWAARLSKEPLTGGVSNMEYGWNKLLEADAPVAVEKKEDLRECQGDQEEMMSIVSGHSGHSHKGRRLRDRLFNGLPLGTPHSPTLVTQTNRASDAEHWSHSATSIDTQGTTSQPESKTASNLHIDRPPAQAAVPEKLTISDWNPPVPPMALSSLPEHVQLESLRRHNSHIQVELERHNLLRRPMVNMYWNRPIYLQKAMANWEKKSQYLMAEIIKYTTYLNALESTIKLKLSLSKASPTAFSH
ncbi:hypothetical protein PtB15_1B149 [Puccinia triticina]|nr:hypothetical protein PtB15_1B149 [Puccinia triticina]